jgi:hypothetical protein
VIARDLKMISVLDDNFAKLGRYAFGWPDSLSQSFLAGLRERDTRKQTKGASHCYNGSRSLVHKFSCLVIQNSRARVVKRYLTNLIARAIPSLPMSTSAFTLCGGRSMFIGKPKAAIALPGSSTRIS